MTDIQAIRDQILLAALPEVVFDGWNLPMVERAATGAGFDKTMVRGVFPGGLSDVIDHFSDWADRGMMGALAALNPDDMRVRDRVRAAAAARLEVLDPWKEAVRMATSYWSLPTRTARGARLVWRTADRIWDWAGDTATDYNRYTKRILLSGVLTSTTLSWLGNDKDGLDATLDFLDRRIDNVMSLGKMIGKFKKAG